MSIFDSLNNTAAQQPSATEAQEQSFTFAALPESVEQLKALPEADLSTPFRTAALAICAFCAYAAAPDIGIEMLNFLKGPQALSGQDLSFLRDRFAGKPYLPFSYFEGAAPDNNYTPAQPYRVKVSTNPYSFEEKGYARLFIKSGGADAPRPITLRRKGEDGPWYLWEYPGILSGIVTPKSDDPWA